MGLVTAAVVGGSIAAAGAIGGSMIASNAASKAANRAGDKLQQGADDISAVDVPTIDAQMVKLQQLKLSGQLTPEQIQLVDQQITELNKVKTDPALRDAQMQALSKLQQIGSEGGLTAVDKAQLNDITNASNRNEQSNRNAVLQNAAQRGMSGSGLEQASELMNSQNAAQEASNQGFNVAAQAQQRALQAIQAAGQTGGAIRQQDYGEQAAAAQSQVSINIFNAANKQNIGAQNTAANNASQQYNLQRSDLENTTNNQLANQQEIYNKGLYQQQYANQLDKAKAQAASLAGQAQQITNAGQAQANLISGVGSAAGKIGTSVMNWGLGQPKTPGTTNNTTTTAGTPTSINTYEPDPYGNVG